MSDSEKGFAIHWTADHIQTGYETAYAVGIDRAIENMEDIQEMYDGAVIVSTEEVSSEMAKNITRRRASGV